MTKTKVSNEEKAVEKSKPVKEWRPNWKQMREFRKVHADLEDRHGVFYMLWEIGQPLFSDSVPTSCVKFEKKDGKCIQFVWNPEYWDKLDTYTRSFITCHEALHVMLNHGTRMKDVAQTEREADILNTALDIAVNHSLIDFFGFERDKIKAHMPLCWIDTIFPNWEKDHIEEGREWEYYYKLLMKKYGGEGGYILIDSLDSHEHLEKMLGKELADAIKEVIKDNLSDDERQEFLDKLRDSGLISELPSTDPPEGDSSEKGEGDPESPQGRGAGTMAGDSCWVIPPKKYKFNYKWQDVIKKWRREHTPKPKIIERWDIRERRHAFLDRNFMLPAEREEDLPKRKKKYIDVFFFQDVSGSCVHMMEMFFNCAKTFPTNVFNVTMFSFDTVVHEVKITDRKLRGGGGTAFAPIEEAIQVRLNDNRISRYPDAVFVFTDGCSWDRVEPQMPERWYWFLDDSGYSQRDQIPADSHIYNIGDFKPK